MVRWKVWYVPFVRVMQVEVWDEGREEKLRGCVAPKVAQKWLEAVKSQPPETAQQAYELLCKLAGVK